MSTKWDIVLVSFPFREDSTRSKTRPCVIIDIDSKSSEYVLAGISKSPRGTSTEYPVKYCKQANLDEGSVIMTDHIVRVLPAKDFTQVGRLDKTDRVSLIRLMSQ